QRAHPTAVEQLPPALREAFVDIGRKLPAIWATEVLSQPQRKALLWCLVDKVVVQRLRRDMVHTRMVWKGGATTTYEVPGSVDALADCRRAGKRKKQFVLLCPTGHSAETIAAHPPQQEYRPPQPLRVLPRPLKPLPLKQGLIKNPTQPHPRRKAGYLTIPQ